MYFFVFVFKKMIVLEALWTCVFWIQANSDIFNKMHMYSRWTALIWRFPASLQYPKVRYNGLSFTHSLTNGWLMPARHPFGSIKVPSVLSKDTTDYGVGFELPTFHSLDNTLTLTRHPELQLAPCAIIISGSWYNKTKLIQAIC